MRLSPASLSPASRARPFRFAPPVLPLLLLLAALVLGACESLPRGAALLREVLAPPEGDAPDFAVERVTGARLALLESWPQPGVAPLPWPAPVAGGAASPVAAPVVPGDVLALALWSADDNSLLAAPGQRVTTLPELRVGAGGDVFLPWIGAVAVAGLTPDAARAEIESRYLDVLPAVQVQLSRAEGRANAASLAAGVTRPGSYPLGEGASLLQILAEGGGVAPGLVNPQIRLHRGGRLYGMAFERLAADPARDVALRGGDRVLVVEDDRVFLSLGAAGRQARHPFPQERISALDALAIIGGVAPARADARAILILRQYPAALIADAPPADALPADAPHAGDSGPPRARMVFAIDLTTADGLFSAGQFAIAPGDLIHISESPLVGTRDLLSLAGAVFGLRRALQDD